MSAKTVNSVMLQKRNKEKNLIQIKNHENKLLYIIYRALKTVPKLINALPVEDLMIMIVVYLTTVIGLRKHFSLVTKLL